MHTILRATVLTLIFGAAEMAGAGPPTAQQVLASARAQAAAQHTNIFLLFEASW
jgi:FlaG/FlaF family flagellin (archaellin)